jgi:acetolactate synthase I/II/III large subunit
VTSESPRSGGRLVVDQLVVHGVDIAFGVPGESYVAVLDALVGSPIRYVTCRHEVGAANMAEAYGKLTGRPGVCMVTRGPGATQASCGVHTAFQDSTPLVLLVGQVARGVLEREAFQEIDYRLMFGPLAKWVAQVDDARRIPELVARAFAVATSGRPGPVVLALPEDVLAEQAAVPDASPFVPAQAAPAESDLERARELLQSAERPLVVVGGQPWSAEAHDRLGAWCAGNELPVASAWRCQDYVDNTLPVYAGHLGLGPDPRLAARLGEADVLLVIGARLGDIETAGYAGLSVPTPPGRLVHVYPDADELGRVYQPALAITAAGPRFVEGLDGLGPLDPSSWRGWTTRARADYLDNLAHRPGDGAVDLGAVMAHLRTRLPDDAVLTNGAGNFTVWAHRFYEFRRYGTQLAPRSGAMGYGVPAAVAAKIVDPGRTAVCVAGDGDFLMSAQELATAVQYELPIVVIVADNGMYGTIRMHQELQFPGRVSGTDLRNPDFAALARAYGGFGERVEETSSFLDAFERALAAGVPAVLHLVTDPDAITPRRTLGEITAAAVRSS